MPAQRIPITNVFGGGDYTARLLVGSSQTPANVIMDTGSSTIAIKTSTYAAAADSTRTATSLAQDVIYGTGAWAGPVIRTDLALGGVAAVNDYLALTDDAAPDNFGAADGILGLAYNGLNQAYDLSAYLTRRHVSPPVTYPWPLPPRKTQSAIEQFGKVISTMPVQELPPFFTTLVTGENVPNTFAFLTHRSAPKPVASDPANLGTFVLGGGKDQTGLFTGAFADVAVVDDVYYNTNLTAVQVGSRPPIAVPPLNPQYAATQISNSIIDSGTNSLAFSTQIYQAILADFAALSPSLGQVAQAAAQSQQGIPNSQVDLAAWPTLTFTLQGAAGGSVTLTCAPQNYWQLDAFQAGTAVLQINDMGMTQTILGLPLFNGYYVVFDRALGPAGVVSFATQA
jgi:hypothetical protein